MFVATCNGANREITHGAAAARQTVRTPGQPDSEGRFSRSLARGLVKPVSFKPHHYHPKGSAIGAIAMVDKNTLSGIYDLLSGVYNRRYLEAVLPRILEKAVRENQLLALLLCDLDGLGQVNVQHGVQAGDCILAELPKFFKAAFLPTDVVGRIGGQRFVVCLPNADAKEARLRAEDFRRRVENVRWHFGSKAFHVTVSIGVAAYRQEDPASITDMLVFAEVNLHYAKHRGRNRVVG
jgi:diguanylate cyclase (GGDEF)-like protein